MTRHTLPRHVVDRRFTRHRGVFTRQRGVFTRQRGVLTRQRGVFYASTRCFLRVILVSCPLSNALYVSVQILLAKITTQLHIFYSIM